MNEIQEISDIISKMDNQEEISSFLTEILTNTELLMLSKRWRILKMLKNKCTQRDIANNLNVSLCKVTRGAKVLKNKNSVVVKYLEKE